MARQTHGDIGDDMPKLSVGNYRLHIELLSGDRGILLVETASDVKRRYERFKSNREAQLAKFPETWKAEEPTIDRAMEMEISDYKKIRDKFGTKIEKYYFEFRTPLNKDVEGAEEDALTHPKPATPTVADSSPSVAGQDGSVATQQKAEATPPPKSDIPVQQRPEFRRSLVSRTFISSDYPGLPTKTLGDRNEIDWPEMRTDITNYLEAEVASRIYFAVNARDFLEN